MCVLYYIYLGIFLIFLVDYYLMFTVADHQVGICYYHDTDVIVVCTKCNTNVTQVPVFPQLWPL